MLTIAFALYMLLNRAGAGASAIYDAICRFYDYNTRLPRKEGDIFWGFEGCTRSVLEYTIDILRDNWSRDWISEDLNLVRSIFNELAQNVSLQTNADVNGIYKWCFWCRTAALGDRDIYLYFAGGDFTKWDFVKKTVSETLSDKAAIISDSIEYGLEKETKAGSTISGLIPVLGILGACYLVKKILD